MEESKFLEAQNLKDEIHYLENWIKDTKRENIKIGVIWKYHHWGYTFDNECNCLKPTEETIHVNELPMYIKDEVIHLVERELEKLKRKFELL